MSRYPERRLICDKYYHYENQWRSWEKVIIWEFWMQKMHNNPLQYVDIKWKCSNVGTYGVMDDSRSLKFDSQTFHGYSAKPKRWFLQFLHVEQHLRWQLTSFNNDKQIRPELKWPIFQNLTVQSKWPCRIRPYHSLIYKGVRKVFTNKRTHMDLDYKKMWRYLSNKLPSNFFRSSFWINIWIFPDSR